MALWRIVKFGLQNFRRNIWLSLATVSMLVLTLVTVNVLVTFNVVTQTAIASVEEKIDITVYFEEATEETVVAGAQAYLLGLSQVRDVVRVTPDMALERFREIHADDEDVLSALSEVGENPFGFSLIVTARDANDFPFILAALEHPSFSQQISQKDFEDYEAIISSINRATNSIRLFGMTLSAIFLIISILIVVNTVRVAIYVHREEIAIMRLVGASSGFIRAPFWFEALFYSFLATVATAVIAYPVLTVFERYADQFFFPHDAGVFAFYLEHGWQIFLIQFAVLAMINVFSTSLAMRKHLQV